MLSVAFNSILSSKIIYFSYDNSTSYKREISDIISSITLDENLVISKWKNSEVRILQKVSHIYNIY